MRQFEVYLEAKELLGLGVDENSPLNSPGLLECYNLMPTSQGLETVVPLQLPVDNIVFDRPFPQIFFGKSYRILATRTAVYTLVGGFDIELSLYPITPGRQWDLVDYWNYILMTNGNRLVYTDTTTSPPTWTSASSLPTTPLSSTMCDFKGQLILGDIKGSWYGCGSNHIVWSKIGSIDCTPGPVAGFAPMPWSGKVLKVLPLGEYCIIYGSNGIMAITPNSENFKFSLISTTGAFSKQCVAGSKDKHVFVSNTGELHTIKANLDIVKRSGLDLSPGAYRRFINDLSLSTTIVSCDEINNRFYISDSRKTYMLTDYGLCQVAQHPTSIACWNDTTYGIFLRDQNNEIRLRTVSKDHGITAIKMIQNIELDGHSEVDLLATVDWSNTYKINEDFKTSRVVPFNPKGVSYPMTSGMRLQYILSSEDFGDVQINGLKLRMQLSDKTSIRGVYGASSSKSQSDNG